MTFAALTLPKFGLPLAIGLLIYSAILLRYPQAWLFVIPLALPTLDLAPWTGRFYFDELDIIMLISLAGALWHYSLWPSRINYPNKIILLFWGFMLTSFISLLIGLLPLQIIDANSFNSYWSSYNSLRVGKGFLWGGLILIMLHAVRLPSQQLLRIYSGGATVGLIGVIMVAIRERWQYVGLLDFAEDYRITSTFSSMHIGGSHIEAYLVCIIPFLWLWIMQRRQILSMLAGVVIMIAALYTTIITISRGSLPALFLVMLIITLGTLRKNRRFFSKKVLLTTGIVIGAAVITFVGIGGSYFQHRLTQSQQDLQKRINHWTSAIDMMPNNLLTHAFGMGLGTFPITYMYYNIDKPRPARFAYLNENRNYFLRLSDGETLYIAQRIPIEARKDYTLSISLRSTSNNASLSVPLCEKHLLNSYQCQWQTIHLDNTEKQWQTYTQQINSGPLGQGNRLSRRPTELSLYNPTKNSEIDIDNISLKNSDGIELIYNGDFTANSDRWFFKTHSHLAWHIKNLWYQIYFEQGLAGLIIFCSLCLSLIIKLGKRTWNGDILSTTILASISSFLAVGLFGSLFDSPRLTTLFLATLALGIMATPKQKSEADNNA
jgi:hypothetical protein